MPVCNKSDLPLEVAILYLEKQLEAEGTESILLWLHAAVFNVQYRSRPKGCIVTAHWLDSLCWTFFNLKKDKEKNHNIKNSIDRILCKQFRMYSYILIPFSRLSNSKKSGLRRNEDRCEVRALSSPLKSLLSV